MAESRSYMQIATVNGVQIYVRQYIYTCNVTTHGNNTVYSKMKRMCKQAIFSDFSKGARNEAIHSTCNDYAKAPIFLFPVHFSPSLIRIPHYVQLVGFSYKVCALAVCYGSVCLLINGLLLARRNCLPPTPDTLHLGCSYHMHSNHRFLSTLGLIMLEKSLACPPLDMLRILFYM